ncbi:AraC family ligand binding domain-containing protein [Actinospica sp. MGRD01-02]|uniref:AraC family ligand binding domain-containing protein n=1 Tax=Actinospica acidithermotolerans TaxID=2828514 RepID=A0A941IGR7_9ACTN|nr:AraC family ligand binding domain-containing protein [Actinospica acidithermotolerans]MBR7824937.1 AraC family ligand binding domain-containing protein [Actinospica acidithermotolerans]
MTIAETEPFTPPSPVDEPPHEPTAIRGHINLENGDYRWINAQPVDTTAAGGYVYQAIQGVAAMSASAGSPPAADADVHQVVTGDDGTDSYVRVPGPEPLHTSADPKDAPNAVAHWTETVNDITSYIVHSSVAAVTSHHCLPDDSGGSWYTGDRATFNVPPLAADTARIRKVGTYQGRDLYRENLDADATAEPALAPAQRHKCVTLPGSDLPIYVGDGEDDFVPTVPDPTAAFVQPVTLEATDEEQSRAATFTASLWEYIRRAGGPRPDHQRAAIYRRVFKPEYLADLPLPTRSEIPDGQMVTLSFSTAARYTDRAELIEAYNAQPRTWVFERAHHTMAWLNHAAAYLARLSGSKLEVLAAVFDSRPQDETPGAHTDEWYSVIVQMDGAKTWTINPGADQQQYTTQAGDVLLIPEGVVHATATPGEPGHSRHIQFTLCRHTIYTTAAPSEPVAIATAA